MRRLFLAYLLMAAALNVSGDPAVDCTSKTALTFGMVPATSSSLTDVWVSKINRQILKSSCFKLSFGSAVDFQHYIDKANQGDFDVLAVPAHIASYLIATADFKPVAFLEWESSYLYVVPNDSNISSIDQIEGSTLALLDPLAEASILVKKEVSATHRNVNFQHFRHHSQIFNALVNAKMDVGVALSPIYNGYKKRVDMKIRVIHTVHFPSHGMLLAAPHTSEKNRTELFKAFAALEPNSDLFWQSFKSVSQQDVEKLHRDQVASVEALKILISNIERR